MPRRKRQYKRNILPDPKFNNVLVAKFINHIMERGKKSTAEHIVYDAFEIIAAKTKKDPIDIFDLAMRNVGPQVEVRAKRVGGANYQVPVEVRGGRRNTLAFRWIIGAVKRKSGRPMATRLANELMDAAKKMGTAMKKRDDTHRMAEANKAFAHYA
ncbi:MAG: 30S ribosomal protein S7 [bacterium]